MTASHRTGVLVIGAGAAGMYAAIEARRQGAQVALVDKSMVGRGGATVMAQMTVAAAVGHAEPDTWQEHFRDTVASGKGLCNEVITALVCHDGPRRIFETGEFGVNWARRRDRLDQVTAPGHQRKRCCYVGALQTGSGVTRGLKKELRRQEITTFDGVFVTRLVRDGTGAVVGAAALDIHGGEPVAFWAPTVILACGGLTEMYARNSASVNMTGDAYALALEAGASLVDAEMVQFFPIATLAPRIIGLDPIMWDPFRYKLGGRLLNGHGDEFIERYAGEADEGDYTATRDVVTAGILKEVEAGRGSPAGGAYLDFTDLDRATIHAAFPTAVDRLLDQGIDISRTRVEVAPTAHFTIGGIQTDIDMATRVPGLYAAGEAAGGMHGANRLSGNALTEAFVAGARAGLTAARACAGASVVPDATAREQMAEAHAHINGARGRNTDSRVFLPAVRSHLKDIMWKHVGCFRSEDHLKQADDALQHLAEELLPAARVDARTVFNMEWREYLELQGMVRTAQAVLLAASARQDSRGAHQREDFPEELPSYLRNTVVRYERDQLSLSWDEPVRLSVDAASWSPPE